jgi:hypothetical protein
MNIQINGINLIVSLQVRRMIQAKFVDKLDQLLPALNNELKTAFLHIQKDKKYKNYTVSFDMLKDKSKSINMLIN